MTPEEIELMREEQKKESKNGFSRFGWLAIVEKLARGDITKFEEVTNQNYIACLNLLSFWKEREAIQNRINKQIK